MSQSPTPSRIYQRELTQDPPKRCLLHYRTTQCTAPSRSYLALETGNSTTLLVGEDLEPIPDKELEPISEKRSMMLRLRICSAEELWTVDSKASLANYCVAHVCRTVTEVTTYCSLANYVLSLFTICTDISTLIFVIEIRDRRKSDTVFEQLVRCNGHYVAVRWGCVGVHEWGALDNLITSYLSWAHYSNWFSYIQKWTEALTMKL